MRDIGSGALEVDGSFELRLGEYRAHATLRARDDPQLASALARLGALQQDGSTRIELQGPLLRPF